MICCKVEGCPSPKWRRGWCVKHYSRWRRNGTTDSTPGCSDPLEVRIWHYVEKVEDDESCWPWTGAVNSSGYGIIRPNGDENGKRAPIGAHRAMALITYGHVGDGDEVHHLCQDLPTHTILCVRPDHLQVLDAVEHRRIHGNGGYLDVTYDHSDEEPF